MVNVTQKSLKARCTKLNLGLLCLFMKFDPW